jgi:hypothetical protein
VLELPGQQQRQGSRPAADIEQAAAAVEHQLPGQAIDQLLRVRNPALNEISSATRIQRRIPFPLDLAHVVNIEESQTRSA